MGEPAVRGFFVSYGLRDPNDPNYTKIGTFEHHADGLYQHQVIDGEVHLVKVINSPETNRRGIPTGRFNGRKAKTVMYD